MTKKKEELEGADLFSGAGGTFTGLLEAAKEKGYKVKCYAINHWQIAIDTLGKNYPEHKPLCSDLERVDPRTIVPSGHLDILIASPECTHFSNARGGEPMNKQSRASIKWVQRWLTALDVEKAQIENVKEFLTWGPLHRKHSKGCEQDENGECLDRKKCWINRPIQNRKGEYFNRFIAKLRELGYVVEWRILNSANYGDATTRRRLFIQAWKHGPIIWPEPTHMEHTEDMFGKYKPFKPAKDIIDWSIRGTSIFRRKKPLAANTMQRILTGFRKSLGGAFILGQQSKATPRSVDEPIPTIAGAGAIALIEPYIIGVGGPQGSAGPKSTNRPLPTVVGSNHFGLVEPFIVALEFAGANGKQTRSVDKPLQTITGQARFGLVEPFLITTNWTKTNRSKARPVKKPVPSITGQGAIGLIEPFIIALNHGKRENGKLDERSYPTNAPMPTLTSVDAWGLVEPYIVTLNGTSQEALAHSQRAVNEPLPTITGSGHLALAEPFLVEYNGNGSSHPVSEPVSTITGSDRFGLVEPYLLQDAKTGQLYLFDILFRMLTPKELARAMGFPEDYQFTGNRDDVMKQIGNAVSVELAKALVSAAI